MTFSENTVQTRGTIIGQDNGFAQAKSLFKPFVNLGLNVETSVDLGRPHWWGGGDISSFIHYCN